MRPSVTILLRATICLMGTLLLLGCSTRPLQTFRLQVVDAQTSQPISGARIDYVTYYLEIFTFNRPPGGTTSVWQTNSNGKVDIKEQGGKGWGDGMSVTKNGFHSTIVCTGLNDENRPPYEKIMRVECKPGDNPIERYSIPSSQLVVVKMYPLECTVPIPPLKPATQPVTRQEP